jgi:hypothetical protein
MKNTLHKGEEEEYDNNNNNNKTGLQNRTYARSETFKVRFRNTLYMNTIFRG